MCHSAGIIRDGVDADYWLLVHPFPDLVQFKQMMLDADLKIDFALLGMVVEAVTKKSYNQYVIENIISPLGLAHTGPEYSQRSRISWLRGMVVKMHLSSVNQSQLR